MDVKKLTKEQHSISRRNRLSAWKYFYPEGNGMAKKGYVLHHKDPHFDVERYIQWNIEDLQMLTLKEHNLVHKKHELMRKPSDVAHKGSNHYYNKVTNERRMFKEVPNEEWEKGLGLFSNVALSIGEHNGSFNMSVYEGKSEEELTKIRDKKRATFYAKPQEERDIINGRRSGGQPVICINTR